MPRLTKGQNVASFFATFLGGLQQQFQQAEQRKRIADETTNAQAQFRLALGDLASRDPQTYNDVIQDPAIRSFMDPNRPEEIQKRGETLFDRLLREKKEKKAGPRAKVQPLTPVTGARLTAAETRTKAEAAVAEATTREANVKGLIADYQAGKIKDPKSLADQLEGIYGRIASPTDIAVAGGGVTPSVANAQIPGTKEWKESQAAQMFTQFYPQFQVVDPTVDLQRIKALVDWNVGLRDEPPDSLPQSWDALRMKIEQQGMALRAQQYKHDENNYVVENRKRELDTALTLSQFLPVEQGANALAYAQTYLRTGELPKGVTLPLDKDQGIGDQLREARLLQLQADLKRLRVADPAADAAISFLQLVPQDQRPSTPAYEFLKKKLGEQYGWEPKGKSSGWFVDFLDKAISFGTVPGLVMKATGTGIYGQGSSGPTTSPDIQVPFVGAQADMPRTTESPVQAVWTPELEAAGQGVAERAKSLFTTASEADKKKLRPLIEAFSNARKKVDVPATIKAMQDLDNALKLLSVR